MAFESELLPKEMFVRVVIYGTAPFGTGLLSGQQTGSIISAPVWSLSHVLKGPAMPMKGHPTE